MQQYQKKSSVRETMDELKRSAAKSRWARRNPSIDFSGAIQIRH